MGPADATARPHLTAAQACVRLAALTSSASPRGKVRARPPSPQPTFHNRVLAVQGPLAPRQGAPWTAVRGCEALSNYEKGALRSDQAYNGLL